MLGTFSESIANINSYRPQEITKSASVSQNGKERQRPEQAAEPQAAGSWCDAQSRLSLSPCCWDCRWLLKWCAGSGALRCQSWLCGAGEGCAFCAETETPLQWFCFLFPCGHSVSISGGSSDVFQDVRWDSLPVFAQAEQTFQLSR